MQGFTLLSIKYILQWLGKSAEELLYNKTITYMEILGMICSDLVLNYREAKERPSKNS